RNLKVNMLLDGLTSEPVLLPVWVMAYRYQDNVYRFLINGQTGHAIGTAPTSWRKMLAVVGGIVLAFAAAGVIISLIAAMSR
ncbi:MAG TPA: zinc ribbon domain-containing protein, partial [Pirellulaceae bacterium]|nr:zinc ribbon domain-containing protein [Pirellulaceae bacterium]